MGTGTPAGQRLYPEGSSLRKAQAEEGRALTLEIQSIGQGAPTDIYPHICWPLGMWTRGHVGRGVLSVRPQWRRGWLARKDQGVPSRWA